MSVFDIAKDLSCDKNMNWEDVKDDYVGRVITQYFAHFPDTILLANAVNAFPCMSEEWQFEFYKHSVSPRRRYSKWIKPDKKREEIELIENFFQVNSRRAKEIERIIGPAGIKRIRELMEHD